MPPKIKTDTQTILTAAFEITRSQGIDAVTAKNVAGALNTSVGPIFRAYKNMEELKKAVITYTGSFLIHHLKAFPFEKSEFMTYGLGYIEFARREPKLFETLMSQGFFEFDLIHSIVAREFDFIVESALNLNCLSKQQGDSLFFNVWLYTHGIACMAAMGNLNISGEEAKKLLENAYHAFLNQEKGEKNIIVSDNAPVRR